MSGRSQKKKPVTEKVLVGTLLSPGAAMLSNLKSKSQIKSMLQKKDLSLKILLTDFGVLFFKNRTYCCTNYVESDFQVKCYFSSGGGNQMPTRV